MAAETRLGGLLRHHRRASGLTQEALAERAGVSARTVSDLERGVHARARRTTVVRIADALGLVGASRTSLLRAVEPGIVGTGDQPLPSALRPRGDDIFVGRMGTRALLEEAWRSVADGRTRIVALQGEAGIGKSSVVRRCVRGWYDAGAIVLFGQCDEDSIDPYRPFVQALRTFAASIPAPSARALAEDNGGLRRLVPDLANSDDPAVARPDQLTVLEGVRTFLEALSHEAPCVLVVEDLRWSDASSLALLRHIGRVGAGRLLVLTTIRLDAPGDADPVRATVTELHRMEALDLVTLDGLTREEVQDLVRGMAGLVPPQLVDVLHHETAGNPLFVRDALGELIAADAVRDQRWRPLVQDGLAMSQDVEFVVHSWFERLSPETRSLLQVASVIGPAFDVATLARIEGVAPDTVAARLDEAAERRLVVVGPQLGTWEFRHGVVRAGLYREIGSARRARLHRLAARALEASPDAVDIGRLAHHSLRAVSEPGEALPAAQYAQENAERAMQMLAWEEAAAGFDLALGALAAGGISEPALRCDLLCSLGEARTEALQRHRARPAFIDAARIAIEIDAETELGRAAYGYAYMTKQGDAGDEAVEVWDRALDASRPPALRSMLLSARSTAHRLRGESDVAEAASVEALAVARTADDDRALCLALANRSAALWDSPALDQRIALGEALLDVSIAHGADDVELDARSLLVLPLLAAGRTAEFDAEVATVRADAARSQRRFSTAQSWQWIALRSLMHGDYDAALAAGDHALDLSDGAPNFTAGHFALRFCVDRLREPGRPVDPWLTTFAERDSSELTVWIAALASAHANAGDLPAARSLIRRVDPRDARRLSWNRVVTLAMLAEVAAATRDQAMASLLEMLLLPYDGTLVVVASGTSCEGAVSHYLGLLHEALGDDARARCDLERAIALERRADAPALAARSERALQTLQL